MASLEVVDICPTSLLPVLAFSRSRSIMSAHQELGFDPAFYLHHCNIDRLLSLWSAINPGIWVTPGKAGEGGTRTIPPNETINIKTGK